MDTQTKTSLTAGLLFLATCMVFYFLDAPIISLLFVNIVPGPLYGIILLCYSGNMSSPKALLLLLFSMGLYYTVMYSLNNRHYGDLGYSIKIIVSSTLASVLLKMVYDWTTTKRQAIPKLISPAAAWLGVKASALAAFSAYTIGSKSENDLGINSFQMLGLLSIFPLWQYLFSKMLHRERQQLTAASQNGS